jgi:hypothetical protein
MQQVRDIATRIQPLNDSVSLTTRYGPQVSDATGRDLLTLMAQAQAAKPNQMLPEGTPDMYLRAWEEMADRYGTKIFAAGLWKALSASKFFPDPLDIDEQCRRIKRAELDGKALAKIKAADKAFADSGEPRVNVAEMVREVAEKLGKPITQAKEIDLTPVMVCCPACSYELPMSPNIRLWSLEELRDYVLIMGENKAIADRNREASMAAKQEVTA